MVGEDVDGDGLRFEVVQTPTKGNVASTGPNTVAYKLNPDTQTAGTDTFKYRAIDSKGLSSTNIGTVTITITGPPQPPNHAPTVKDIPDVKIQITRPPAPPGSVGITLVGEDVDGDGLRFEVVQTPTKGNVASTGPNTVAYKLNPDTQTAGTDTFKYRAIDSKGLSSTNMGTVTITITGPPQPSNNPPVVDNINNVPVQITTPATPISITLVGRDADGDKLTFSTVTQPTKGTVDVTGNTAKYTLNSNIQADTTDTFTYKATDSKGASSNIGTVTLKITGTIPGPGSR